MSNEISIPEEIITNKIYLIRGQKVMLSTDLADLYQVETRRLNEQVKRNLGRFPERYMFQLTMDEYKSLRSQNAILGRGKHSKYPPYAFTEHGILMLSSVLKSERAEQVNIKIIDVFIELREAILTNKDLLLEMEDIRKRITGQDERIDMVFDYLTKFITQEEEKEPIRKVGFKTKKGK